MKFEQIEPALARGVFSESLMSDPAWTADVKYDGHRAIAQFLDRIRFTSRRRSVKDGKFVERTRNVPHLSLGMLPQRRSLVDSKALVDAMKQL